LVIGFVVISVGLYLCLPLFQKSMQDFRLAEQQRESLTVLEQHYATLDQLLQLKILAAQAANTDRQNHQKSPVQSPDLGAELDKSKNSAHEMGSSAQWSSAKYQLLRSDTQQKIDTIVSKNQSREEALLNSLLWTAWSDTQGKISSNKGSMDTGAYDAAIDLLLELMRERARNYHLKLDDDFDLTFDLLRNSLPATISALTYQDAALLDAQAPYVKASQTGRQLLNAQLPAMRSTYRQLQSLPDAAKDEAKAYWPSIPSSDDSLVAEHRLIGESLEHLISGLLIQQQTALGLQNLPSAESKQQIEAVNRLRQINSENLELAKHLRELAATSLSSEVSSHFLSLQSDRQEMIRTLCIGGILIAYLLCGFYLGTLQSLNALTEGTQAFCNGHTDVRIQLKSRDELQQLATNFNSIAQEAERLVETIDDQNRLRERDLKILVDALGSKNEELFAVNQRVHEELNLARSVQLAILPQIFPNEPGWSAHACMHPARELGGDFYDCFPLPDGRYGVLVADVSGKGVGAAFFMAVSRTVLLDSALTVRSPSQVLALANDLLCTRNPMDLFVTACYALYNPIDGSLIYASAGHHPPLIRRQAGSIETLISTKDMALGVLPEMRYSEHSAKLDPGDTLLMFTDGVTEAFSGQDIAYGEERLKRWLLNSKSQGNAAAMVDALVDDVAAFVAGAEASDDLTCLILCRKRADHHEPVFEL